MEEIFEEEIWKDIPWYEWLYQASTFWNIKVLSKKVKGRNNSFIIKKEKVLKLWIYKWWYLYIDLHNSWIRKKFLIHRLVAQSFIPNTENKPCVNHIDWNKQNNNLYNLEWCTVSANQIHSIRILWNKNNFQLNHPDKWKLWRYNKNSIKILQYTKEWEFIKEWGSMIDVERELLINHSHISQCCSWKLKSSQWFVWKYKN